MYFMPQTKKRSAKAHVPQMPQERKMELESRRFSGRPASGNRSPQRPPHRSTNRGK